MQYEGLYGGILLFRVAIKVHFDAAHFLKGYPGKCAQLHGHRWVVEAHLSGNQLDELGMLIDFSLIKQQLSEIVAQFDHTLINNTVFFSLINPTAENLAKYIFTQLSTFNNMVKIDKIRIFETPDAWAEYEED